jgi:hypothetical protein
MGKHHNSENGDQTYNNSNIMKNNTLHYPYVHTALMVETLPYKLILNHVNAI